jgi:two-component system, OmpR family, phosphate regulon sensor histidine kinase PhoR
MYRLLRHLTSGFALLIGLVFLVAGIVIVNNLSESQRQERHARLVSEARLIAQLRVQTMTDSDALIERLSEQTGSRITILDVDGQVITDSHTSPGPEFDMSAEPEIAAALVGQVGVITGRNPLDNRNEYAVAIPIEQGGEIVGVVRAAAPGGHRPPGPPPAARPGGGRGVGRGGEVVGRRGAPRIPPPAHPRPRAGGGP